jgi:hypothetical protein
MERFTMRTAIRSAPMSSASTRRKVRRAIRALDRIDRDPRTDPALFKIAFNASEDLREWTNKNKGETR